MGKLVGFLVTVLVVLTAVVGGGWFYTQSVYTGAGPVTADGVPRTVMIEPGSDAAAIAGKLEAAGAIKDDFQFHTAVRLINWLPWSKDVSLKAGEYLIPSAASMEDIVGLLSSGKSLQYAVVIPEGLTSAMVMRLLAAKEWKTIGGAPGTYKLTGDTPPTPAEGVMLPGDYAVQRGDTVESVVQRAIKAQQDLLANAWPNRQPGLPFKTQAEAIVLASIVEKETGNADERPQVAALFINRLRRPMRLEADATIVYGITRGEPLGRKILQSELDRKTAWNTYQIDGLPPTPICNPGADAIRAVLDPPVTKSLFFVADGTGGHVFADTYAEHQRNVAIWRKVRAANEKAGVNTPAVRSP